MSPAASLYRFRVFAHRFRRRLFFAFTLPLALFAALSLLPPKRYTAEAVLLVRLGPEYVYQPEAARTPSTPNPPIPFDRGQAVKAEVAILHSSDLHAAVVQAIGVDALFPELTESTVWGSPARHDLAHAIALLDRRLDVTVEKDAAVITLAFAHHDSTLAAKTLDTLLKLYFDKRQEFYRDTRVAVAQQLLDAKRAEAQEAAQTLEAFKQQHAIYAFEEQRAELLRQRDRAQALAITITHRGLDRKIATLTEQLNALNAVEAEFNARQSAAQAAQNAVTLFTQHLDEAVAREERLSTHTQSVRVVQAPTSTAEPTSIQPLIVLLGVFVAVTSLLATAVYSSASYDTGKVVHILQQRRKRLLWRVK